MEKKNKVGYTARQCLNTPETIRKCLKKATKNYKRDFKKVPKNV